MRLLLIRLSPSGFAAFVSTARMQHRYLPGTSWRKAVHTAWFYGPKRRTSETDDVGSARHAR